MLDNIGYSFTNLQSPHYHIIYTYNMANVDLSNSIQYHLAEADRFTK